MIKAGALYFAIVVAFVIAILCGSAITLSFFYKTSIIKKERTNKLMRNLSSGIKIMMSSPIETGSRIPFQLFAGSKESVLITSKNWGIYELGVIETIENQDTLSRAMLIGYADELGQTSIYLKDENRPLSLSGNTRIYGNAFLPKSGVRTISLEGMAYQNKKLILSGNLFESSSILPPLLKEDFDFGDITKIKSEFLNQIPSNRVERSFLQPTLYIRLKGAAKLKDKTLVGNIVVIADSSIYLEATCSVKNVQFFAPKIRIQNKFKGNCQLFATDSIVIGSDAKLNFPSALILRKLKNSIANPSIRLQKSSLLEGVVMIDDKVKRGLKPILFLDSNCTTNGEIYWPGAVHFERNTTIKGKISCENILMKSKGLLYQNILFDVKIDRPSRSRHYVGTSFIPENKKKKIIEWLD